MYTSDMHLFRFLSLCFPLLPTLPVLASAENPAVHFTLSRRGGRFATHEPANLTRLNTLAQDVESLYAKTERIVDGNRLGRRWKSKTIGTVMDEDLMTHIGNDGSWFFDMPMSEYQQSIEIDLDMLSPDHYFLTTTSSKGSTYNVFVKSHVPNDDRVHPLCRNPTDLFHLVQHPAAQPLHVNLSFPLCSPHKSTSLTLLPSGSLLGLSPQSNSLTRFTSPSFLDTLQSKNLISQKIWSIALLTPHTGILTFGSSIAHIIESIKLQTEIELANFGNPLFTPQHVKNLVAQQLSETLPGNIEQQFHWVKTAGAHGLWTTLMSGVWISGSKVLKNQPVLLDVNCPFIFAPPLATRRFYESVGGAQRIKTSEGRETRFWKIPCLNKVSAAWEFAGKMYKAFPEGRREEGMFGPAGGSLSLGKLQPEGKVGEGSGYCVGVVVESSMGVGSKQGADDPWANSGMKDVWVLGEPFFRGIGVVFDAEEGRIGLRMY